MARTSKNSINSTEETTTSAIPATEEIAATDDIMSDSNSSVKTKNKPAAKSSSAKSSKSASSAKTSAAGKSSGTKSASKAKSNTQAKPKSVKLREQSDSEIFALDIGTRTVVGILGHLEENIYYVDHKVTVPHSQRAMIDGQIEDIREVSRIVNIVKAELEEKSGMKLSKVAIAAAGRALKTRRAEMEFDVEEKDALSEDAVKSFEVDTVLSAQAVLDEEVKNQSLVFYCVGHTVINYTLDDYKIKTLIGHRGKKAKVDLIAAFLPNLVVESLYSVMDLCGLEVISLTLEPIAAMNVIIPPEVRLINVALVDIGAGTSDIAISQNGSIVAYAMSTLAGDEITEEIIRNYLVDFPTAEEMKQKCKTDSFSYTDILGFEHEIQTKEFFASLFPAVGSLADNIAENIIKANGKAPAAVFLVGGGSLIPDLAKVVAEKLEIPETRVAVGGRASLKHIEFGDTSADGPEYVTPIGIGVTATINKGYDFSVVTLNGKKMRIFDTRTLSLIDLLVLAGYKTNQIIGRSGRNLTFTLNGERQSFKGEVASPAEIKLNGQPAAIDTPIKQSDIIEFTPASSGMNATIKLSDIAGDVSTRTVRIDDVEYNFGIVAKVNDKIMSGDYQIQNFDNVTISEIETLGDLMMILPFDTTSVSFYLGGKVIGFDYFLKENDDILVGQKVSSASSKAGSLAKAIADREEAASKKGKDEAEFLEEQLKAELEKYREKNPDFVLPLDRIDLDNYEMPTIDEILDPDFLKKDISNTANTVVSDDTKTNSDTETVDTAATADENVSVEPKIPAPAADEIVSEEKTEDISNVTSKSESAVPKASEVEEANDTKSDTVDGGFYVNLNGKMELLEEFEGETHHEFIELMAIANIDLDNPPPSGNMILLLNGKEASFVSHLSNGDTAVIKWADE